MSSDATQDVLARTVLRAARGPAPLIASLVAAWHRAFPDQQASAALGCSGQALNELSLCLKPRTESWLADVSQIGTALTIDADRLITFLRAAEAIERFGTAHPSD